MIIALVNQKGGVGKTTTAVNIASYLAFRGKKTLLLDLDPQGNASSGLGFDKNSLENTSYDVLMGDVSIKDAILETGRQRLSLLASNIQLAGAEISLVSKEKREYQLKKSLELIKKDYDFIIIDCPPSLSLLTLNALTAADSVLIPIQTEYYALEGVTELMNTINLVKQSLNPRLDIFGIVLTMFDARTQLSKQVADEVRTFFETICFETVIPRNVRLSEAPSFGQSVYEYDHRSKGAKAYESLVSEIIKRANKKKIR